MHSQEFTSKTPTVQRFAESLAIAGGLGLIPKAPGTWGSLPGLAVGAGAYWLCASLGGSDEGGCLAPAGMLLALLVLALLSLLATWSIGRIEAAWACHDDKRIVIDEVVGQAVAIIWFKPSLTILVVGFGLFRLFDIWKPGPAGWVDRHLHSPFATLADDLIAGAYVAVILALWQILV